MKHCYKDIEDQAEDDEKEQSIGLGDDEEEGDDGANSMDLEGDEEEEEEEEEKNHICSECGKWFKSGKALGGHKRIHVLENQKLSMVRPKMMSGETEVDCCVCHKKFISMKALHGHMRFHPDRGWKGVLSHPLGNSSSSTLSIDDYVGEFTSSDYDDDDDDDDDGYDNIDAKDQTDESNLKDNIDAKDLLLLATTAEAVNLDVAESFDSPSVEEMMMNKKKRRLSEIKKVSSSSSTHDHHQLGDVVAAAAAEEGGGGGAREKHVCVTCYKSFTSYQALGGHRASHNKVKILENHQARANSDALLLGTQAMITGLPSAQALNTSLSSSNNGDHVCDICHKSFPTGQALGGHKRRHWTGPVSSEAATSASTAPAAGSSSQVTEAVQEVNKFEFDLNELPPNEE
ncbi:zinc finger protein ZAT9-like [Raphanus sativus]|uniref:Zinc finger protein ZAT9-like n=1 Tax=Raphanus sativus TaxID=3726 RepID=A0A9W3DB81_RAPSA|nr:zinc finger protein ZAT9-like [Raphanus sativus]